MAGDQVIEITDDNFEEEVIQSDVPVLVDFFTSWCGPCKMLAPTIDEVAGEYAGQLKVGKLDAEANMQTAMKFQIQTVPTIIFFKDGQMVQRAGFLSKPQIKSVVDDLVS